jgi:selenocysteine lyase/cysteine desulfurase
MPQAAIDAMAAEAAAMREPRIGKAAMERLLGLRARARAAAARALGAPEDEVALTSSTSQGIGLVCAGLDWSDGGEVVTPCPRRRSSGRSARIRGWWRSPTSSGRPA